MRKSILEPCEKLKEKLIQLTNVVDEFQKKKYTAVDSWLTWLRETEEILKQYGFTENAELAGARSSLLAEYVRIDAKISKKKRIYQRAMESIESAQRIVVHKQKELESKIDNVRNLVCQILIPLKEAGLVNYTKEMGFNVFLETLLVQLKSNEQLAPSLHNALATVGKYDLMRIMAENIELSID